MRLQAPAIAATLIHIASAFRFRTLERRAGGDASPLQIPLRNFGNQMYTTHIEMATPPVWFNFSLATTQAYSVVAGPGCKGCSTDPNQGLYDPTLSSSYVGPQSAASSNLTLRINGKNVSGNLAQENCALMEQDGTWWRYRNQTLVVASSGTDSSALGTSGGVAGLGQTGAQGHDTLIGQYLSSNQTTQPNLLFGFAVASQTDTHAPNGVQLQGDSSGGFMHLDKPDPAFFTGNINTFPVASTDAQSGFSSVPGQLGSFDWTVQTQGWLLKTPKGEAVTGAQGMYATMEMAYPYILLPQSEANKLYSSIPGAVPFVLPTGATDSRGNVVFQDNLALSWSVPCDMNGFSFFVNFQGMSIPLLPSDLFTTVGNTCVGNVKGWADSTRQTGILGSSFFRNAYVVFTATTNPGLNTVGLAQRSLISGRGKDGANKGVIIGSVIGGVAFLVLVSVGGWFFIRKSKHRSGQSRAPSAVFAGALSGSIDDEHYGANVEKQHSVRNTTSSFLGFGGPSSKGHTSNYAAEPWTPPPASTTIGDHQQGGVVVAPWTPQVPAEQAFLSPTGNAFNTTAAPVAYAGQSPPPQRPMSGQSYATSSYAPLPTDSPGPRPPSTVSSGYPTSPTPLLAQPQQYGAPPPPSYAG